MGSSQSEFMGPSGSTRLYAEAAYSMRAAWAALIASDHSHSIMSGQKTHKNQRLYFPSTPSTMKSVLLRQSII